MSLVTGQPIEFRAWPAITREQLRAYAEASGDPNRIHLDEEVARSAGLPGVIAHGMLSMAFLGERALEVLRESPGLEGLRLVSFSSRFKAMTFPGDVVSVGGVVKLAEPDALTLDLQAKNQKGELTTFGSAKFKR
jgi:acyl dehydratase